VFVNCQFVLESAQELWFGFFVLTASWPTKLKSVCDNLAEMRALLLPPSQEQKGRVLQPKKEQLLGTAVETN
jgi:hypothetical protein